MTTIFYLLGYLAVLGFVCLAFFKIRKYFRASPLHIRWELYPVPHEGPDRASYGGSYMEEENWWMRKRYVDQWCDIRSMLQEILFLHATYENNPALWVRTYPFHLGMYLLMGGTILLVFAVLLELCGTSPNSGLLILLGNIVNATSLFGGFCVSVGGIALILRRRRDAGLRKYTTREQYINLGGFSLFGILTMLAWVFNPCYYDLANEFVYNLFTGNFAPLPSVFFALNMLTGFFLLISIPITNMGHLIMKYFLYHNIRWDDEATVYSMKNRKKIREMLRFPVSWSAPHIAGDGLPKTWLDVAASRPDDICKEK